MRSTRRSRRNGEYGADVSGEGVQRDLLPIVEGSVVMTRYGPVKTDHVLFIAAGAFHQPRPSDLIPELQGRFPIRVELNSLIGRGPLQDPDGAAERADEAVSGVARDRGRRRCNLTEDGLREMARLATQVNARTEDIGARRLQTIVERVLEEVSFELRTDPVKTVTIDRPFVTSESAKLRRTRT